MNIFNMRTQIKKNKTVKIKSHKKIQNIHIVSQIFLTTTSLIAILTVIFCGGSTQPLLGLLKVFATLTSTYNYRFNIVSDHKQIFFLLLIEGYNDYLLIFTLQCNSIIYSMKQCNKLIRKNKGQERVHDRAARRLICLTCDSGKAFDILLLHKESLSYFLYSLLI